MDLPPGDRWSSRTKTDPRPGDELPDIPVADWLRLFRVLRVCSGGRPVARHGAPCPRMAARRRPTTWVEKVFAGYTGDALPAAAPSQRHSDLGADTGRGEPDAIGAVFFVGLPEGHGDLPPGSVVSIVERGERTICSFYPRRDEGWERGPVFNVSTDGEGVDG